jgi:hypothetical protein
MNGMGRPAEQNKGTKHCHHPSIGEVSPLMDEIDKGERDGVIGEGD